MGHVKFDNVEATLNEGRNRMLLTLVITPLALGLIIVIMAAVKKLKPQPVMEKLETENRRERPEAPIQSKARRKKVSLEI